WDGYGNILGWLDGNGNIFYHVAVAMSDSNRQLRTIDVEPDEHMLIKPGELIDIVELSPLTLQDRRIYNLLILNAWDSITEAKEHRIHKRDLRGSHNVNDRVGESLLPLMEYGPGGYSAGRTHAKSAFIYATVLEGAIAARSTTDRRRPTKPDRA